MNIILHTTSQYSSSLLSLYPHILGAEYTRPDFFLNGLIVHSKNTCSCASSYMLTCNAYKVCNYDNCSHRLDMVYTSGCN